ncbi:MAG: hypothetical protein RJA76_206 [Bacteroidota bacterium]|jgi:hypothetical protein
MKKKNLISLTISFAFIVLGISGILLWLKQKAHPIEMAHTIFGLLFVSFAIFHIKNNWDSITGYSKSRKSGSIQKEFIVAAVIAIGILVGALTEVLEPVAEFGRIFAKGKPKNFGVQFEEKKTNENVQGKDIFVLIQKKQEDAFSKIAVSLNDTTGKLIQKVVEINPNAEGPQPSLMISSKANIQAPFNLEVDLSNMKESSKESFRLKTFEKGVQRIELPNNSKLQQVIFEVK